MHSDWKSYVLMRPLSACVPLKDPPSTTKYPPSLLPLHLRPCSMSFAILMCIEVDAGADNAARSTFAIRPQFKYTLSTRRLAYTLLYVGRKLVWLCHNSRIVWQAHWHWLIASLDQPIMLLGATIIRQCPPPLLLHVANDNARLV